MIRRRAFAPFVLFLCLFGFCFLAVQVIAAPYAAMVMDARTGEILHSRNADTRLHPASLTKMMTLYVAFEAVERGQISLDTPVKISRKAAAEQPSKLGLRAGSKIRLRYLIRASAVKSANDAATAIAEAISGSEAAFARRMNRTAKALGMTRTTSKNAHGRTESGHLSTARDMTLLGRRMIHSITICSPAVRRAQASPMSPTRTGVCCKAIGAQMASKPATRGLLALTLSRAPNEAVNV